MKRAPMTELFEIPRVYFVDDVARALRMSVRSVKFQTKYCPGPFAPLPPIDRRNRYSGEALRCPGRWGVHRYTFLLGLKLGGKQPIWRWELFRRRGEEGSIRAWENPTNILLGGLTLVVSLTCYAVSWKTVMNNPGLWWIAGPSALFFLGSLYALVLVGLRGIHENGVADPPTTTYDGLRLREKGKKR